MLRRRLRRAEVLVLAVIWIVPVVAFLPILHHRSILSSLGFSWGQEFDSNVATPQAPAAPAPARRPYTKQVQNIRRKKFIDMIPRLQEFHSKYGHTEVTKNDDDTELYEWVKNLRYNYLWQVRHWPDPTGNRRRLSEEKLQQLADLGFLWETTRDWKRWPVMLKRLDDYRQDHGTTRVDPATDQELFEWTKSVHYSYRHQALNWTISNMSQYRRPTLSEEKMQALKSIGFDWNTPPAGRTSYRRWQDMFPRLEAFRQEYGHTRIPIDHEDRELFQWTQNLISNYGVQLLGENTTLSSSNRLFLSPKKLQQLQELGFDWERRSTMWERRLQELRSYWKEHGHCQVTMLKDPQLAVFCKNQRREYRRYLAGNATSLTPQRMESLEHIQFDWARSHEENWKERREELREYSERTGHADVPQDYANNHALGQWVMNQRTNYKQLQKGESNGLTQERIRELERMGFEWNIPERQWKAMCQRLKEYQEREGHMEIPSSDHTNSDLRQWLNEQRHYYRTARISRLTEERISLMDSIPGFEWRHQGKGPTKADWSDLFLAIREKGIVPGAKAKEHIFDGMKRFEEVKTEWTEQELIELWNEEDEDEFEDEYYDNEESRMFLRA